MQNNHSKWYFKILGFKTTFINIKLNDDTQ